MRKYSLVYTLHIISKSTRITCVIKTEEKYLYNSEKVNFSIFTKFLFNVISTIHSVSLFNFLLKNLYIHNCRINYM